MTTPTALAKRCPVFACGGKGSMARRKIAGTMSSIAQAIICAITGSSGEIIHKALASKSTPKTLLTVTIHAPALGSKAPAESPTINSGTPMPSAMLNSVIPPSRASPVLPI